MFEELAEKARIALCDKYSLKDLTVEWRRPQERSHGDAATTIALQLAKKLQKKPQEVAQVLCDALKASPDTERAEVAGAGYVNVHLKPMALLRELTKTEASCAPQKTRAGEGPVIIDYSQPNIAKPLGVHHILSTVVGQCLCNLHRHLGYNIVGWNYIGDWGTQFGKLAVAWQKWGKGKPVQEHSLDELLELYVRFHAEAEKDEALENEARAVFLRLEQGDKELRAFWAGVVRVTKASLAAIYDRLHVHFDTDIGESFYEDKMQPILEEGRKKKVFVTGEDGALIVEFPEETTLPPFLVQKGDGATLYATRDLAQIRYRIDTYHPQAILYVVDVAQQLYFQQLFATVTRLDWDLPQLEHVLFGRMRFAEKAMSTRKGTVLKLEHVLDEAVVCAKEAIAEHRDSIQTDDEASLAEMMGTGALKYGILSQNRKMDLVFDWKKALSFEGNSAPYLQYTHARAQSVLRQADRAALPRDVAALTDRERALTGVLIEFPDVLQEACTQRMPHTLANYLYHLCQEFNSFYNSEPILKAEAGQKALRLALTALSAQVLKAGAELLTLRVPDRM
ncbi:MAG TPA: arginine--tRNA ligase [Candidatus Peribacter riflensis]|uniref:Arginine--tRNA ligase n=1 Tax=Candidatus Peribacter riflensis TaxID=1735162 RepID=A0A0S1SKD6_9BACT|nr:MAG: arginyl-tRNA synthetase [Candidatus Peribacter riflensis]OGJ78956.1 MAG: arginine--tRNA ligase [Candidatus Peribacteria bacterium RIFOXYB1_FULL_57_12]ALM11097.1 MAG: arginyl-tRNA synthetase [Candidatus Peribacter riflensis]ALM12200.1 MAG: arginyl-tRNA synthetase [Candidatus Peribacter riflensis]ALM13303.1 MAG: arginyl-tRNA synthetase [Candidatus Peribacter riflensis]